MNERAAIDLISMLLDDLKSNYVFMVHVNNKNPNEIELESNISDAEQYKKNRDAGNACWLQKPL